MLNLAQFVREQSTHNASKTAIYFADKSYNYAQLDALSNQVANYLISIDIKPGDKVALSCPNLPYFPIVYYGILKTGAVVVPLNVLLKPREIAYHLDDSDAKALFVFEGSAELPMGQMAKAAFDETDTCENLIVMTADPAGKNPIEGSTSLGSIFASESSSFEIIDTKESDTAVILYTSGTTGVAKGAELSHSNMVFNAIFSSKLFDANVKTGIRTALVVLPLFHSFGQTVLMNAMFYSADAISLLPRFDAEQSLQIIKNHKVNIFAGVPTMYWALLNQASSTDSETFAAAQNNLKVCASGGAALPVDILTKFEDVFDVPIMEGYGLSETSPVASFNHLERPRKPGSVGQPIFGIEMKIVDSDDNEVAVGESGEIVIRGHNIMKGYYKRPQETAEAMKNGWFHSGDIGIMDEDGYFFIVDRVKDMVLRGGYNVYPREIEEVLMTHPDISLAAVIGVPSEAHGEEICAHLILSEGAKSTAEEIRAWCKETMASYKYPRIIKIRDTLPMTATGKILKRELKKEEV